MSKLYLWANPVKKADFLDHTWVTTYPFTNGEYPNFSDIPAGESYWYCWGDYHAEGKGGIHHEPNGAIGQADADINIASKLVKPNQSAPVFPGKPGQPQDGAIVVYAVDGVCQNLANQLLYATGRPDKEPVRVEDARGYQIATFFYGNYGLSEQWDDLKKAAGDVSEPADDFSTFMRMAIGDSIGVKKTMEVEAARMIAQLALRELRKDVLSGEIESAHVLELALGAIWLSAFAAVDFAVGLHNFLILFPSLDIRPEKHEHIIGIINQDMLRHSFESLAAQAGQAD
jgi:hypothetical protein